MRYLKQTTAGIGLPCILSILLAGIAFGEKTAAHVFKTDSPEVPWKVTGPLHVSPPLSVQSGVGPTTLTLQRGVFLVELEGGSIYRDGIALAEGIVTTPEHFSYYGAPNITYPVLLQIGIKESRVHTGTKDYHLQISTSASGTGTAEGVVWTRMDGTSYVWTSKSSVSTGDYYYEDKYQINLLPGQTYRVSGYANGDSYWPTSTSTSTSTSDLDSVSNTPSSLPASKVSKSQISSVEESDLARSMDSSPQVAIVHASGYAGAQYIAPTGSWSRSSSGGGYGSSSSSFGPILAFGPPLPPIDPLPSTWVFY